MPATHADWSPHIVVATVVERDGRFLLIEERINEQRVLNQPAGHWEPGETLVEAARRETLEEAGWDVEPTHLLGVYEWQPAACPTRLSASRSPQRRCATIPTGRWTPASSAHCG